MNILKTIWQFLLNLKGIIGVFVALAGIFTWVSIKSVERYKEQLDKNNIENYIKEDMRSDSLNRIEVNVFHEAVINRLNSIGDTIGIVRREQKQQSREFGNLKTLVTREFAKQMTPQEVLEMVNMLEKKNNGYEIVPQ